MKTKRINLISGPRNISTALMYSFANRKDTCVVDEPMYAYYLSHTQIDYHPSTDEILKSQPQHIDEVLEQLIFQPIQQPIYFIKGMAHHYVDLDLSFLKRLQNVFLIRNPYQLIASFAKIIEHPKMSDIGLKREWELCNYLLENGQKPIVMDSSDILAEPRSKLAELCNQLDIPFTERMLSWEPGPIPQDGVWAKYWYKNVWESTGFTKQKTSDQKLPEQLIGLYEESLKYYELLKAV